MTINAEKSEHILDTDSSCILNEQLIGIANSSNLPLNHFDEAIIERKEERIKQDSNILQTQEAIVKHLTENLHLLCVLNDFDRSDEIVTVLSIFLNGFQHAHPSMTQVFEIVEKNNMIELFVQLFSNFPGNNQNIFSIIKICSQVLQILTSFCSDALHFDQDVITVLFSSIETRLNFGKMYLMNDGLLICIENLESVIGTLANLISIPNNISLISLSLINYVMELGSQLCLSTKNLLSSKKKRKKIKSDIKRSQLCLYPFILFFKNISKIKTTEEIADIVLSFCHNAIDLSFKDLGVTTELIDTLTCLTKTKSLNLQLFDVYGFHSMIINSNTIKLAKKPVMQFIGFFAKYYPEAVDLLHINFYYFLDDIVSNDQDAQSVAFAMAHVLISHPEAISEPDEFVFTFVWNLFSFYEEFDFVTKRMIVLLIAILIILLPISCLSTDIILHSLNDFNYIMMNEVDKEIMLYGSRMYAVINEWMNINGIITDIQETIEAGTQFIQENYDKVADADDSSTFIDYITN